MTPAARLGLGLLAALYACAGQPLPSAEPFAAPAVAAQEAPTELSVVTWCDPTKRPAPVATLTWSATEESLSGQLIEVTAYRNGFESELFVRLSPTLQAGVGPGPEASEMEGPLADLAITAIEFSEAGDTASVRVEGTEAGIDYVWRVVTAEALDERVTTTVVVRSATCSGVD